MAMHDIITTKLTAAFAPQSLRVEDESHQHQGHAGHRPGGETHFRLYIVSEAFRGKSRIERHRMINAALASELEGSVHALAIHAQAPGETRYELAHFVSAATWPANHACSCFQPSLSGRSVISLSMIAWPF